MSLKYDCDTISNATYAIYNDGNAYPFISTGCLNPSVKFVGCTNVTNKAFSYKDAFRVGPVNGTTSSAAALSVSTSKNRTVLMV
ncbi:hypothetical protein HDV05_007827, partial [Chytridiales sp. JEL 0842]